MNAMVLMGIFWKTVRVSILRCNRHKNEAEVLLSRQQIAQRNGSTLLARAEFAVSIEREIQFAKIALQVPTFHAVGCGCSMRLPEEPPCTHEEALKRQRKNVDEAAHRDEARRIMANIAKLPEYCKGQKANESTFDPVLF
jgi:hypothetical protein